MAHQGSPANASYCSNGDGSSGQLKQQSNPIFHDFLGSKIEDNRVLLAPKNADIGSSEASSEHLASSSAAQNQVVDYLEGVPFYTPRNEISGLENSNRIVGIKRSNPDSGFMGSYRNQISLVASDFIDRSHTMKILRNGAGADQPSSNDNEEVNCMQPPRRASSSLTQHSLGTGLNANFSKWERSFAVNKGPPPQNSTLGSTFLPRVHQVGRSREFSVAPLNISHPAADEGSRTGKKNSGIFSRINDVHDANARHPSHILLDRNRQKSRTEVLEHKSFDLPSQERLDSQMTIFYNGQAHVFDDVHPNKADIIMALAGSSGGSWSTALAPKSNAKPILQSQSANGEIETGIPIDLESAREYRRKSHFHMISSPGVGNDPISTQAGEHPPSIPAKEIREPVHAARSHY